MKKLTAIVAAFLFVVFFGQYETVAQQIESPAPSPASSVTQVVGFTKITIDYSSPAVKGRKVFGDLIPWDQPWRAGANMPTKVTFSTAVRVGDKDLRPGSYNIFMTPSEKGDWTIHFNGKNNSVFVYLKDGKIDVEALVKDDVASVKVKPVASPFGFERMLYTISAEDNKTAKITMFWDKTAVSFMVDTRADQTMERFKAAF
jgi:hypothetical protein